LATARLFHREDAKVAITGRDQKKLDEAAKTIGDCTLALKADVSKLTELDNLFALIKERWYQALNRVDPHRQWLLGVLVCTTAAMIVFLLIGPVL
jgi:NAD(P)-dependent dehydrogenase (short-subunit alcohol dehydrogenase family)